MHCRLHVSIYPCQKVNGLGIVKSIIKCENKWELQISLKNSFENASSSRAAFEHFVDFIFVYLCESKNSCRPLSDTVTGSNPWESVFVPAIYGMERVCARTRLVTCSMANMVC